MDPMLQALLFGMLTEGGRRYMRHKLETSSPLAFEGSGTPEVVPHAQEGGSRTFDANGNPQYHGGTVPESTSALERLRAMRLRLRLPAPYDPPQSYTIPRKGN